MSTAEGGPSVGELGEAAVLDAILPVLPGSDLALVGPGDDCAVLAAPDGRYCVTTDVLVEGRHFRTAWSTGHDIGRRAAAQNLADVAAMGARPVALVVALVLPSSTPLDWVTDLAAGLAAACQPVGAGVVGGDLSAGDGLVIAVTAHGDLEGLAPVLRSGARPGDLLVHVGTLGRSAAGLALLEAGALADRGPVPDAARQAVEVFRAPHPPLAAGPALAQAGATAMMDVSDSLLRDAGRMARASGVAIDLAEPTDPASGTATDLAELVEVARFLGAENPSAVARQWVLTGGEDHGMLAAVPPGALARLPPGCRVIGRVLAAGARGPAVTVEGAAPDHVGWDHFTART
ncbi:MAG: thiamine-phosphate kinase [Actinomyces sp.]|uniref:thiamine-phosphate kinase n=1 Tax=Actinomyces sp. TaxID=29317 RepID=UPI0026DCBB9F|nr:thiamine-phosphate kinase [Actinomyces sp.]MDO4242670.1 thiamine-phosphate kinase [Actinomyces sp.]